MKKLFFFGLLVLVISIIGFSAFKQINKSAKASRIDCQKEVVVFERIYKPKQIELLKNLILNQKAKIIFKVEKSKYMKSKLFEYVDINKTEKDIEKTFGLDQKQDANDSVIDVLLYENDKLDPGKKNDEAKKYAGYLVFDFYVKNELTYKIQIDFMDFQGKDIQKRIDCVRQSVQNLN